MLRLLKVKGHSLEPTYQEGDFVFISKIPFFLAPPRPGDVIAFRQPGYGTLIKQIEQAEAESDELYVRGTHPDSVDSRQFGPVRRRDVLGKVIWHIRKA
jgi:signal peptidase I